jgi:predicted Fe-S protein YdhL (DUF1289 family)
VFAAVDFNQAGGSGPPPDHSMPLAAPHSPCINVCNIGPDGWCQGCYRTREEIAAWISLDAAAQWAVVRACDMRRPAYSSPLLQRGPHR